MAKKKTTSSYSYGQKEKPSFFKRLKRGFVKWALVALPVAGVGGYHFGTVKTSEEVITHVTKDQYTSYYYYSNEKPENDHLIRTADGDVYRNEATKLHFKSDKDVEFIQKNIKEGEVYKIKSYGLPFLGKRNILSFEKVAQKTEPQQQFESSPLPNANTNTPVGLSGQTTDIIIEFNNMSVEMTVPAETVKNGQTTIKINKITKKEPVVIIQN